MIPVSMTSLQKRGLIENISVVSWSIHAFHVGKIEVFTRLSPDRIELGGSLTHEVWLGTILNLTDVRDLRVTCHIRATPRGWATLGTTDEPGSYEKFVKMRPEWHRPPKGRRGFGSIYFSIANISTTTVHTTLNPPRLHGGRRAG